MFTIDITLKNTPLSLSIQKKTEEDAEATYKQILDSIGASSATVLQLTCDKQVGKKIGVLSSEISAIQMSEKSGSATSSGRPPGFFALAE